MQLGPTSMVPVFQGVVERKMTIGKRWESCKFRIHGSGWDPAEDSKFAGNRALIEVKEPWISFS